MLLFHCSFWKLFLYIHCYRIPGIIFILSCFILFHLLLTWSLIALKICHHSYISSITYYVSLFSCSFKFIFIWSSMIISKACFMALIKFSFFRKQTCITWSILTFKIHQFLVVFVRGLITIVLINMSLSFSF